MDLGFLKRMNAEYNELDDKIIKGQKALKTITLDKTEKSLLVAQLEHMKAYRQTLNDRINYAEKKYKK